MKTMDNNEQSLEQIPSGIEAKRETKFYFYRKRYQSRREKQLQYHNNIKGRILEFIAKTKWLKSLDIWEVFKLKDIEWIQKHNLCVDNILKNQIHHYDEIELEQLSFFEIIEIDDFSTFRKKIISKFGRFSDFFGREQELELRKRLEGVENAFDSISFGQLVSLKFGQQKSKNIDFIDSVYCSYIKTNESYFIIRFDVTLSKKGKKLAKKIVTDKDTGVYRPNYAGYLHILKTKRFFLSESYFPSLKSININNFISDVNTQLKLTVTKHFPGFFSESTIFQLLPSIQLFLVEDLERFNSSKDKGVLYTDGIRRTFSLADRQVEIRLSDSWKENGESIQLIKQKGHGKRASSERDLTDYDKLESHDLIESLSFPCAFAAVLKEHAARLNYLKREIYDQIKISGNRSLWTDFLLYYRTKKYLRHKHLSIQMLLTMKRFEQEFTDQNIARFSRQYPLDDFESIKIHEQEGQRLTAYLLQSFRFQINKLDGSTRSLNEVFKSLEELNSYKTNLFLQLFSLVIAVLAFIFTFDKAKDFVSSIIDLFR